MRGVRLRARPRAARASRPARPRAARAPTATSRSACARMTNHTLTASSRPNASRLTTTRVTRRSLGEGARAKCQRDQYDRDVIGRPAELTRDEVLRYSRHLTLPEVGVEGQQRLKAARVLCIGAGGLGSPAALYLAAAGVGTIGLVDDDVVDVTQPAAPDHPRHDGRRPIEARRRRAIGCARSIRIRASNRTTTRFGAGNALDARVGLRRHGRRHRQFPDALSRQRRLRAGRAAERVGQHLRFEGQASVFAAADGPCYRCLHPEPPPAGLDSELRRRRRARRAARASSARSRRPRPSS